MAGILGRASTMEGMLTAAYNLLDREPNRFSSRLFHDVAGVVIVEALQVGCLVGAQTGTGILLRHNKDTDEWSPPLAIGLTGLQVGMMAGLEKKGDGWSEKKRSGTTLDFGFSRALFIQISSPSAAAAEDIDQLD